jgi:murein DD-endopeptidase MepM/ murein hydrolase activator NlpD
MDTFKKSIAGIKDQIASILPFDLDGSNIYPLDLSADNPELHTFDILDTEQMTRYIHQKLSENEALIAMGGYGEDRLVYRRSLNFGEGEDARSIHLGVDIWCEPNTPVFAPLDAEVHSFRDNEEPGDYGPTIILLHRIGQQHFYSLYGHLTRRSLEGLTPGKIIKNGEKFAEIGDVHENGQWPPHLHFQLIKDMKGLKGDFPGVSSKKDKEMYMALCPDPKILILK